MRKSLGRLILVAVFAVTSAQLAISQTQTRTPSHCLAFAQNDARVHRVSLKKDEVQITYLDHSMFMIKTLGGLKAITDFNGLAGPIAKDPDIVTMNKGHTSHFTETPNDNIRHVLRGWDRDGKVARHELDLGEMLIRNVTTDIRGAFGGQEPDGNSIFVFEVAGLCIGHLGHLHHVPTDEQFALIGRLDVVMAAVDGGMTLDTDSMVKVLNRFRASVVLPMHWFGRSTLNRFVVGMRDQFDVVELEGSALVLSQDRLPSRPTIMILPPKYYTELE